MSKLRFLICYMCTREREKEKRKLKKKEPHTRNGNLTRSNETFLPVGREIVSRSCTPKRVQKRARDERENTRDTLYTGRRIRDTSRYSSIASSRSFRAIRSSIVLSVSSFPRESSHDGDRRAGTLLSPISSKLLYALILIEIRRGRERHVRLVAYSQHRSLHATPLIPPSSSPSSGDAFPAFLVVEQKVSTSCRRPHVFPMRGPLVRSRYK